MILEEVSNSGQQQVLHVGNQGPGEVSKLTSTRRNALIVVFALECAYYLIPCDNSKFCRKIIPNHAAFYIHYKI